MSVPVYICLQLHLKGEGCLKSRTRKATYKTAGLVEMQTPLNFMQIYEFFQKEPRRAGK